MANSLSIESVPSERQHLVLRILLLGVLLFAPLFRAGQAPLALMTLEIGAILMLMGALWFGRPSQLLTREIVAIVLLAALPLLYLIPLPSLALEHLPGRENFLSVLRLVSDDGNLPEYLRITIVPNETQKAWLFLLLPISVYVTTRFLPEKAITSFVMVVFFIAAAQATLGLIQFGDGRESAFYLGMEHTHFGSAVGTYTNRNHLAGLFEMVLPLVLALLIVSIGGDRRGDWRQKARFLSSGRGHKAAIYAALMIFILVAVAFTRSRTGIALVGLGVLLSVFAFSTRIGGENIYGATGTLVAVALGLAITVGLVPVLDRFSVEAVAEDSRWMMFDNTLTGIGTFFPVGSGPGTFQSVFPAFQSIELGSYFINRAHNDYLEWLFEGGLITGFVIAILIGLYLAQWPRVWIKGRWTRFRFLQVGAGIGIFLILIHELVDYNLHTPANLIYFAFLAGIFFRVAEEDRRTQGSTVRDGTGNARRGGPTDPKPAPISPMKPPPDQIKNPFLD